MKYAKTEFTRRLARHYDELKWLYLELYRDEGAFTPPASGRSCPRRPG